MSVLAILCAAPAHADNSHSLRLEADTDQYVQAPDSATLDISGDLTLEAWVKWEALSYQQGLITKWKTDDSNRSYALRWYDDDGGDHLGLMVSPDGANFVVKSLAFTPEIGQWYHVAVTYRGSTGDTVFYVNGIAAAPTFVAGPASGAPFQGSAPVRVGNFMEVPDQSLDGLMDEVRVWDVVRTDSEILEGMEQALIGSEPNLKAYWRFDGESLADATANGNDLTNVNGATFSTDVPFGGDQELTPEEQAAALIESVESYSFPKHVANMYLANLKKVPQLIFEEKYDAALKQLSIFVDKVQRHQDDGTISDEVAEDLLAQAQALMLAIN